MRAIHLERPVFTPRVSSMTPCSTLSGHRSSPRLIDHPVLLRYPFPYQPTYCRVLHLSTLVLSAYRMTTIDPPTELFLKNSENGGNYFIYGFMFDRNSCPDYKLLVHTAQDRLSPQFMVTNACIQLGIKTAPEVELAPLPYVKRFYKSRDITHPVPTLIDLPHFIVYAQYATEWPSIGVYKPQMRVFISEEDSGKLKEFEKAFGFEGKQPQWYDTGSRRKCIPNMLSYSPHYHDVGVFDEIVK